jgi:hypothetical protein
LVYATGGRELLMEAVLVDMVRRVVIPSVTLAGAAYTVRFTNEHNEWVPN